MTIINSKLLPLLIIFLIVFISIFDFLNMYKEVDSKVIVVEGWISDHALTYISDIFKNGEYDLIITVGSPFYEPIENPEYLSGAERAYNYLIKTGIDKKNIVSVPAPEVIRHNTLTGALFLREWILKNDFAYDSFILATESVHARKSYITHKRVLPDMQIGVIGTPTPISRMDNTILTKNNWFLHKRARYLVLKNFIGVFYSLFEDIKNEDKIIDTIRLLRHKLLFVL